MAAIDVNNGARKIGGAAYAAKAITPNDNTDLSYVTKGVYVGGSGDITATMADGVSGDVVFKAVPVGAVLPIAVSRVKATGTTATNLVALF